MGVEDLLATVERMAAVVDRQKEEDSIYTRMGPAFSSPAIQAATGPVIQGTASPFGYTEPILHGWRRKLKQSITSGSPA